MFDIRCQCGKSVQVRPSLAGITIQCPNCGDRLTVPPLGTLRDYADRGQAAPTPELDARLDNPRFAKGREIPETAFIHFCGEIGSTGRVSSSAMENYINLIVRAVNEFIDAASPSSRFEFAISCSLTPQNNTLVSIETVPGDAEGEAIEQLRKVIQQTPSPMVQEGPVAFSIYRRVKLEAFGRIGLQPFGQYQQRIEQLGADKALLEAADPSDRPLCSEKPKQTLVQRARRFFADFFAARPNDGNQAADDSYEQWIEWIDEAENHFAETPIEVLSQAVQQNRHDLASQIGLAARYTMNQDWANAIDCYDAAIELNPQCVPLYARRARIHWLAGNRQASLGDWNLAVEQAPHDPWLFYNRSAIFADLEAWPQARMDLDTAHQLAPFETVFVFTRAGIRLSQGNRSGAIEDLQRVVSLDPNSGRAHAQLGWLLQNAEHQDLNAAIEHLTRAIELIPDEIDARIHRSVAYASQNKYELALEGCDEVIRMQPNHGAGYALRGRVLQMQGEFAEAISACGKALELGWETPMVLLARGFAYAATDQCELALMDCDAVEAMEPNNPLVCQLRGMLSFQQGELETAMEALTKALDLVPDWPEPREQLALLHRINENPQAAVDEQSVLVAQQPKCAAHYINRAFAYTQLGDFEKARQDYDQACQLEPENEHIFFLRGCYLMDRQEPELALGDFDRVLSLAEDHDDARSRRASMLLSLRRVHEALADYEKLMAKYPDDPHAYSGHAYANELMGNAQAAEKDFDQLRQIAPENALESSIQSLHGRVQWLESQERYEEAVEAADEIIQMAPDQAIGYRLRAWIHWYTEQHVEALDDYTRLLEMAPDDPGALNARGQVQAEMGEWMLALDDLDRAIERSREQGQTQLLAYALSGRAFALAGISRMDDSTRDFHESIKLCPDNAWAHYNRGIIMYQRGDYEQARPLLERALESRDPPLTKRKESRASSILDKLVS